MRVTATRTIDVPIDTVWTVLSDHQGMENWAPGLSVDLLKEGTEEPNGCGAVRKISTRLPVTPIVEQITWFQPNKRLSYKALSGVPLKSYWGDVILTSTADQQTQITYSVNATPRIPGLERLAARLIAETLIHGLVGACQRANSK